MLLTITLVRERATDLGFLLGKHPDRVHRTELAWGRATVCFPVAEPDRCTAALVVEVDPDAVVRRLDPSGSPDGFTLGQHVGVRLDAAGPSTWWGPAQAPIKETGPTVEYGKTPLPWHQD